jgi:hypothetical protein
MPLLSRQILTLANANDEKTLKTESNDIQEALEIL